MPNRLRKPRRLSTHEPAVDQRTAQPLPGAERGKGGCCHLDGIFERTFKIFAVSSWSQCRVARGIVWICLVANLASHAEEGEGTNHWSFQPIIRPPILGSHLTRHTSRNPIDAFLCARLAERGLTPAPEADRHTLIRRLHFDLIGMPPAPEEATAFLRDPRPDAYEQLVDRLLASPRFGERWGRHWLDVVRYAETHGFEMNQPRPNAWPYRDYVIRAFNEDKPYDRFILEQIAGDLFGVDEATGFLVAGPWDQVKSPDEVLTKNQRADELHDIVNTTGTAFLGLTLGCARCHDHKFDPVPQRDYYAIKAVFEGVHFAERERRTADAASRARAAGTVQARLREIEEKLCEFEPIAQVGPNIDTNNGLSESRLGQLASLATEQEALEAKLKELSAKSKVYAGEFKPPEPTRRFHRGDPMQPREVVEPGALSLIALRADVRAGSRRPGEPAEAALSTEGRLVSLAATAEQERRLALARWITAPDNPLTARVIVNRLWQYHFGEGLVSTPSDFGRNGARPTHPELLDWLATELVQHGWSLKHIHRLIVTSAAYRQASALAGPWSTGAPLKAKSGLVRSLALRPGVSPSRIDAGNRLLWRFQPRRLEAESLRDSILAVAGNLDLRMGGPGWSPFEPNENYVRVYTPKQQFDPGDFRRMIYATVVRQRPEGVFGAFDCPDGGQIAPKRTRSTTPLQALNLLNSGFMMQAAGRFAARLEREAGNEVDAQVQRAFLLAFQRVASAEELKASAQLTRAHGLKFFCRALFNANEFVYVY